jgi:hypothetical protein
MPRLFYFWQSISSQSQWLTDPATAIRQLTYPTGLIVIAEVNKLHIYIYIYIYINVYKRWTLAQGVIRINFRLILYPLYALVFVIVDPDHYEIAFWITHF